MRATPRLLLALFVILVSHSRAEVSAADKDGTSSGLADKKTYLEEFCRLSQVKWPANRTINIVCHGHSVPSGYFVTPDVRPFDSYPHLLHVGLKDRFPYAVINVIVTAIGGENSEQGAARFEKDVLSLRPDVVTIDYALNDRGVGLERARKAWESMIQQAQAKNVKVILLTPTGDTGAKLTDPNDPLSQHAVQIRELAKKYHVGLADSLASLVEATKTTPLSEFMSQVNHPNRKGHELVARDLLEWFPAADKQ